MIKETLPARNYEIREKVKSKIDPKFTHDKVIAIRCPKCNAKHSPLSHGDSIMCLCDLRITLYGAGLECVME